MLNTAIIKKRIIFLHLALCAALFGSQIASADHEIEHLYHDVNQSCVAFIAFEHGASMLGDSLSVVLNSESVVNELSSISLFAFSSPSYFSIRAPPYPSLS